MEPLEKFTFFRSFWEAVKRLPKKDRLPILEAIIGYGLDGAEPSALSDSQFAYFLLVEPVLKKGRSKAKNGKQGGSKTKANAKQTVTHKDIHKDIQEDKEKEERNIKETGAPSHCSQPVRPTIEEVRAYCAEQGYSSVDPQRFVDYYTANGWKVGKNPMKDWRAAVRGWESREKESRRDTGKNNGGHCHGLDRLAQMYREEFGDG